LGDPRRGATKLVAALIRAPSRVDGVVVPDTDDVADLQICELSVPVYYRGVDERHGKLVRIRDGDTGSVRPRGWYSLAPNS
jgi:hypothetical protein